MISRLLDYSVRERRTSIGHEMTSRKNGGYERLSERIKACVIQAREAYIGKAEFKVNQCYRTNWQLHYQPNM